MTNPDSPTQLYLRPDGREPQLNWTGDPEGPHKFIITDTTPGLPVTYNNIALLLEAGSQTTPSKREACFFGAGFERKTDSLEEAGVGKTPNEAITLIKRLSSNNPNTLPDLGYVRALPDIIYLDDHTGQLPEKIKALTANQ